MACSTYVVIVVVDLACLVAKLSEELVKGVGEVPNMCWHSIPIGNILEWGLVDVSRVVRCSVVCCSHI